ncbi:MAG: inorganic diphosphatase [Puniceicoccales bacterium]|jgi:inorganic pyrophosphatase|nr:inorganic diphosphatase [Puniceicoccales bacterium]
MENSYNPDAFFQTFETLIEKNGVTIDRPKGFIHPRFPDLIYPINYGFIKETYSQDGEGIDIFLGDLDNRHVVGVICTVDSIKNDSEVKVLVACSEENIQTAMMMLTHDPMRAILVRRSDASKS